MCLVLLLVGCSDAELEAQNRELLTRAERLEAENERLRQELDAANEEMTRLQIDRAPGELPARGSIPEPEVTLSILINPDGTLYLDGMPVDEEALGRRAREVGENGRAVIAADVRVSHGTVVHIIDILRAANVARYAINVRPEDADE